MALKFSIVIPSFNQASFLEQTIKSILIQDYSHFEIIVMDGGSKDGSLEIIKKYESKLSYWQSKPDGGQASAIKSGFERATGDIFSWLNSDDVYLPGAFTKVAEFFDKNPSIETVTGGGFLIDAEGNPTKIFKINFTFGVAATGNRFKFYHQNGIYQQSTFWKKNAYESVGGIDPQFHFIMDRDLFARLAKRKQFGQFPEMLAAFRFHGENKSIKLLDVHAKEEIIFKNKYNLDKENNLKRKLIFFFYNVQMILTKCMWLLLLKAKNINFPSIKY